MTMAHHPVAPVRKLEVLHGFDKGLHLVFDGLR
jgi:hypothetical protein